MTCQWLACPQTSPLIRMDLVFCYECGSSDLGVCYASKNLGPHLCPTCTQSKVEYETWEKIRAGLSMREQPVA